jgi:aminopeptidase N
LDSVSSLRDGTAPLEGLEIDTDLSWELLVSLVAGGRLGQSDIDVALAADNTANGAQFAAQASAAIPTVEGKRAAWASVFDTDTAPNTIVRYTGIGFQRASDPEILTEFVAKYFDSLQEVWKSRSHAIAEYLVEGMYPAALADVALRDATKAWLDANTEPVALRRLIVENLAGIERALRAQARDSE